MDKLVVGNLKMNLLSLQEVDRYVRLLKQELFGIRLKDTSIVICPPAVHLKYIVEHLNSEKVRIGAQNVFWEKEGSYTGEISPWMVKGIGGEYAIVGHSERRRYFGEDDSVAHEKMKAVIEAGLHPIYCIGETREERTMGFTKKIITQQIQQGLQGISMAKFEKVIFAYEPVWAVGTDLTPESNDIMEVQILIRKILAEKYGMKRAQETRILYGGSVKEKTLRQVCIEPRMNGTLMGRESLLPHEFVKMAHIIDTELG